MFRGYYFLLLAIIFTNCLNKDSTNSDESSDIPKPTGLETEQLSSDSILLSWGPVDGISHYNVYLNRAVIGSTSGADQGFIFDELDPSEDYELGVAACEDVKCSAQASVVTQLDQGILGVPTGLQVSNIQMFQMTLNWTDMSTEASYKVYIKLNTVDVEFATLPQNSTSHTFTNLGANGTFLLGVSSCDASGCSTIQYISAMTLPLTGTVITVPSNLNVTGIQMFQLTLNWTQGAGETHFKIYLKLNGVDVEHAQTNMDSTSYPFTALGAGGTYQVGVAACAGVTCTPIQYTTAMTLPLSGNNITVPYSLSASNIARTLIRLNWLQGSGETSFRMYLKINGNDALQGTVAQNTTSFDFNGLTPGTSFQVGVAACDATVCTPIQYITARTLP